jgi:plastocyanin
MKSHHTPLLAAAALAALLTACGTAATDTAPAATSEVAVDIDTFRFAPDRTVVTAGSTVTWVNRDATRHTVTAGSVDEPDSRFDETVDEVGDEVTATFDQAGTYPYFCVLHPFMTGTIEVTP